MNKYIKQEMEEIKMEGEIRYENIVNDINKDIEDNLFYLSDEHDKDYELYAKGFNDALNKAKEIVRGIK